MTRNWEDDLQDVKSASSPDNLDVDDIEDDNLDPGPDAGNQSGNEDKSDGDGRTVNELRGELLRKQERGFRDVEERIARRVEATVQTAMAGLNAGNQASAGSSDTSTELENMSVEQLQQLYGKASTDEQRAILVDLIATKKASQIVDARLGAFDQSLTLRQQREQSMRTAMERFPELRDPDSTFYQSVKDEMGRMGQQSNDPGSLLSAANEVAFRMGISPAARRQRAERGSQVAGGRSTTPPHKDDSEYDMEPEKLDSLLNGLKHAFPNGVDEKMKERIRKRAREYNKHRNNPATPFVKG